MIESVEYKGILVGECSLPGEGRDCDIHPSHPNGIQLSRDRFLVLYGTRSFHGTDHERSIIAQIREGGYDGRVLRERVLAQAIDDWDPFDEGAAYVKQHGHPGAFGVPKGARIDGTQVPHANVFVARWRVNAREFDKEGGYVVSHHKSPELRKRTQAVEWMQFRLNDAEDDIEVLQPAMQLRQKGYESGAQFCERDVVCMNQSYAQPVALNDEYSQWADVNHFNFSDSTYGPVPSVAALRYQFNPTTKLYEWIQTGPLLGEELERGIGEASVTRLEDKFIIAARPWKTGAVVWMRTDDLFDAKPETIQPHDIFNNSPLTAYTRADGVLSLISGDKEISPHDNGRNPLYLWDIDPDNGFRSTNRRTILDTREAGLALPVIYKVQPSPLLDMGKLLPHSGGREQIIAFRLRTNGHLSHDPDYYCRLHYPTRDEMNLSAVHYAIVRYDRNYPANWPNL